MAEIRHLENWHDVFFSAEGGPIWIKFRRLVQNDMSTAVIWSKSEPDVEFQYGGHLGEFHGMSSQRHVSHCRVLPLGEFTIMIPEPHATLQGVTIQSAILQIVFRHVLFFIVFKCSLGFDERRLSYRLRYTCIDIGNYLGCVSKCSPRGVRCAQAP